MSKSGYDVHGGSGVLASRNWPLFKVVFCDYATRYIAVLLSKTMCFRMIKMMKKGLNSAVCTVCVTLHLWVNVIQGVTVCVGLNTRSPGDLSFWLLSLTLLLFQLIRLTDSHMSEYIYRLAFFPLLIKTNTLIHIEFGPVWKICGP